MKNNRLKDRVRRALPGMKTSEMVIALSIAFFFFFFLVIADCRVARAEEKKLCIMLDPGHGGSQSGADREGDSPAREQDLNLSIALYLKEELSAYEGVRVLMTREGDETVSLDERTQRALNEEADVLISLHNNARGDSFAYDSGCTVLTAKGPYREELAYQEQKLACNILHELTALGLEDRGITLRTSQTGTCYPDGSLADYYRLIKAGVENRLPTIIVEHAFIDKDSDYHNFLEGEEALKALAAADARGIARYYGLTVDGKKPEPLKDVRVSLMLVKDEDASHNEFSYKIFYPSHKKGRKSDQGSTKSRQGQTGRGLVRLLKEVVESALKDYVSKIL